ncbi:MAG TPA: ABC transporter permease [Candidatus Dormibacteraeota bacterium]|nr:ABC transporter permease [Candidatus Dormibacteraeota bacterium]
MKLARDTWLVFNRYIGIFLRNPAWVIIGLIQPILYLLLFAPLLKGISSSRFPPGGAYNVFVPGLLIQLGLFGASGVGFGLIAELRAGVIERFRVTPVSRFALLLGRALRDILVLVAQSLLLLLLSIPFGLHATFSAVIVMLGLVALIGLGMSSLCYAAALALRSEDSYAPLIFTLSLPLLLLSGVLLPLTLAPKWLQNVAAANPLSYAVTAARDMFNGNAGSPDVIKGLVIMVALCVVGVFVGARSFNRAVA